MFIMYDKYMDVLTKRERSYNMSQIKSDNTVPEIKLRRLLAKRGFKNYRVNYRKLFGKPDIVFLKKKIAIFVDGCFWHKCPKCFSKPITRTKFWFKKIESNLRRDRKINQELKKKGWLVIRVWEHDIEKNSKQISDKIAIILKNKKHRAIIFNIKT